jgi:hypothetical protein
VFPGVYWYISHIYMIYACILASWISSCVIDPPCFLCDLFLPLFSQHDIHLGIWHVATCLFSLMSQFLICCCIYFISVCAYVSWRGNSSSCAVFRCVMYTVGDVVLFVSLTITRLRPL